MAQPLEEVPQEEQTERLFCMDDHGECVGLSHSSHIISKKKATIKVHGKDVQGWIVTIKIPTTDGLVRSNLRDPMSRLTVGAEE